MRKLLPLLLAVLLTGCATTQSIPTSDRSKVYDSPRDSVITAVVNAVTEEGYSIETLDRETGMVMTGTKSNSTLAAAFVGNKDRSLQARVTSQSASRSRLLLTLVLESENAFGASSAQSMPASDAKALYDEWFKKIEAQL